MTCQTQYLQANFLFKASPLQAWPEINWVVGLDGVYRWCYCKPFD